MTAAPHSQFAPQLDTSFGALRAAIRGRDGEGALVEAATLERLVRKAVVDAQGQALAVAEANAQVVELAVELEGLMSELEAQNHKLNEQNALMENARHELELQAAAVADANVQAVLEAEAVCEQLSLLEGKKAELEDSTAKLQARATELSREASALASANVDAVALVIQSEEGRKKAETVLREREEQLRQAQRLEVIGQVANAIAHDFNNLLTAIIGHSSLMLMNLDPENMNYNLVSDIHDAGKRGAALVGHMLAFCRSQEHNPQVLCLNDVIGRMQSLLRGMLGTPIELCLSLADELGKIEFDTTQIEQVLVNLAANARDAMPDGGRLEIETRDETLDADYCQAHPGIEPGQYVRLRVTDTGCGIDAECAEHVFEPFFTTKSVEKGCGLGLSTVLSIVKQGGGAIVIHSKPGQGASFEVLLPVVLAADPTPAWA
jgi:signal transduction histidine kinase